MNDFTVPEATPSARRTYCITGPQLDALIRQLDRMLAEIREEQEGFCKITVFTDLGTGNRLQELLKQLPGRGYPVYGAHCGSFPQYIFTERPEDCRKISKLLIDAGAVIESPYIGASFSAPGIPTARQAPRKRIKCRILSGQSRDIDTASSVDREPKGER